MHLGASGLPPPIVYLISRPSIKRGGASLDVTFRDPGVTLDVRQRRVLEWEVLGVLSDPYERLGRRFVILLLHQHNKKAFQYDAYRPLFWFVRWGVGQQQTTKELDMLGNATFFLHGGGRARNSDGLVHRSDSIQDTDYIATHIQGFLGQELKI